MKQIALFLALSVALAVSACKPAQPGPKDCKPGEACDYTKGT